MVRFGIPCLAGFLPLTLGVSISGSSSHSVPSESSKLAISSTLVDLKTNMDRSGVNSWKIRSSRRRAKLVVSALSRFQSERSLVNSKDQLQQRRIECDPESFDPDVGILSCGIGQYCMETANSNLGGICSFNTSPVAAQDRTLTTQPILPCSSSFPYHCDCNGFDTNTFAGSVNCTMTPLSCVDCSDYCFSLDVHFEFQSSHNISSIAYCYNFRKPYHSVLCYHLNPNTYTCAYTINGVACSSCITGACHSMDCTNVPKGINGTCQHGALPIVARSQAVPGNITCPPGYVPPTIMPTNLPSTRTQAPKTSGSSSRRFLLSRNYVGTISTLMLLTHCCLGLDWFFSSSLV